MKKQLTLLSISCFLWIFEANAQIKVEWQADYQVTLADYKAVPPQMVEDNLQRSYFAGSMGYHFTIDGYDLMLTTNFNKYVSAYFVPTSSWIEKGDRTNVLVGMGQLNFDLAELYARKFRKRLYENKKSFPSAELIQTEFEFIRKEYTDRSVQIESEIYSVEHSAAKVQEWLATIRQEINELADFCKECKIKKKKKAKKD